MVGTAMLLRCVHAGRVDDGARSMFDASLECNHRHTLTLARSAPLLRMHNHCRRYPAGDVGPSDKAPRPDQILAEKEFNLPAGGQRLVGADARPTSAGYGASGGSVRQFSTRVTETGKSVDDFGAPVTGYKVSQSSNSGSSQQR